jgi:hypothetical protein
VPPGGGAGSINSTCSSICDWRSHCGLQLYDWNLLRSRRQWLVYHLTTFYRLQNMFSSNEISSLKRLGRFLFQGTIPEYFWNDWGNLRISLFNSLFQAGIRICHYPNTSGTITAELTSSIIFFFDDVEIISSNFCFEFQLYSNEHNDNIICVPKHRGIKACNVSHMASPLWTINVVLQSRLSKKPSISPLIERYLATLSVWMIPD